MLLNVLRNICSFGNVQELTHLRVIIPFQPRILAVVKTSQRVGNNLQRFGTLANAYNLTGLNGVRGDINHLTVHSDVLVAYQLTCSSTSGSNTQAEYYVVQTTLEQLKEYLTGNTLSGSCLLEQVAELLL